jgi:predicted membrane-bound mannosyltransferase
MQLNFRYYAEPGNPYVYAHTGTDIPEIAREIEIIGSVHPDAYEMPVEVVFPDNDYWPLPWYLRKFSNVGFFSEMDFTVPAAPLILIHPSIEKDLIRKLYEIPGPGERYLYTPLYDTYRELRPEVEIRTYLRKDVWDLYQFLQDSP